LLPPRIAVKEECSAIIMHLPAGDDAAETSQRPLAKILLEWQGVDAQHERERREISELPGKSSLMTIMSLIGEDESIIILAS
jgi:hypothetical protein